MNKREFLKTGLIGAIGLSSVSLHARNRNIFSQGKKEFHLPELPYTYDALEPYIDKETMMMHHKKHHASYTAKFNEAIRKAGLSPNSAVEIMKKASQYDAAVVTNGGGYLNHRMFWKYMSPTGGGPPTGDIAALIDRDFGSFDNFKEQFSTSANKQAGAGWGWLIIKNNTLKITATSNQDCPFMDTLPKDQQGFPLLNVDLCEHASDLKYKNRQAEYVNAFWNVVNWDRVNARLKKYDGD